MTSAKYHGSRRLCLGETDLSETRPAGLPSAPVPGKPATSPADADQKDRLYAVARIQRLADSRPAATAAPGATKGHASTKPHLLVITLQVVAEAPPAAGALQQKPAK